MGLLVFVGGIERATEHEVSTNQSASKLYSVNILYVYTDRL